MFKKENFLSHSFTEQEISNDVIVNDVGYEKCKPCHSFGPHKRGYWLLHFVLSGSGMLKKDGKIYEVNEGEAFLIRPDEITTYVASAENPWNYVWLGFKDTATVKRFIEDSVLKKESVFTIRPDFGYELESLYRSVSDTTELLYRSTAMVYKLFAELHASTSKKKQITSYTVKSAVDFIEYNYSREIDVSWLASELGMSRGHFTALFTTVMGVAPYQYIIRYRIAKAQALLSSSTLNVGEIATAVGFASVSRFDFMFQKYVGCSPKAYRESSRKV